VGGGRSNYAYQGGMSYVQSTLQCICPPLPSRVCLSLPAPPEWQTSECGPRPQPAFLDLFCFSSLGTLVKRQIKEANSGRQFGEGVKSARWHDFVLVQPSAGTQGVPPQGRSAYPSLPTPRRMELTFRTVNLLAEASANSERRRVGERREAGREYFAFQEFSPPREEKFYIPPRSYVRGYSFAYVTPPAPSRLRVPSLPALKETLCPCNRKDKSRKSWQRISKREGVKFPSTRCCCFFPHRPSLFSTHNSLVSVISSVFPPSSAPSQCRADLAELGLV